VLALVASQAINCVLSHAALRREAGRFGISMRLRGATREGRVIWNFSVPSVFSNAAPWCANWICSAMLVNQASGYAEMGLVAVANQWRAALMFLPGLLINATLPVLAHENPNNTGDFQRAMQISHRMLVLLVLPITLALCIAAGPIVALYGRGFHDGRFALVYMLAAAAIAAVSSPAGSAIIATGRMWLALVLNVSLACVFILLTCWLIPSRGASGLALAYLTATFAQTLGAYVYLRPLLPQGLFSRNLLVMALIILLALGVLSL
jgi:O-antigen/teichoic acid export membrane protein